MAYQAKLLKDGSLMDVQTFLTAEGLSKYILPHGNEKLSTSTFVPIPEDRVDAVCKCADHLNHGHLLINVQKVHISAKKMEG